MPYQRGANPLALIFVDKPEGDLGLARFDDDIAAAADQGRAPVFVRDRNQRDMLDEVYVEKIVGPFLGNLAFGRKEARQSVDADDVDNGDRLEPDRPAKLRTGLFDPEQLWANPAPAHRPRNTGSRFSTKARLASR